MRDKGKMQIANCRETQIMDNVRCTIDGNALLGKLVVVPGGRCKRNEHDL